MPEMEQQTIFDFNDDEKKTARSASGKIDVVKMSYEGAETVVWRDLFEGYQSLKAITFSSGVNFIGKLIDLFENAEIIFGCETVMSFSLHEIMAFQSKMIDRIRTLSSGSKGVIVDRIEDGSLHLFVARTQLSHEKIYLLSGENGKKRVIMGSANMSFNAFGGRQRENICYVDGEEAYNWYLECFENLKENSSDEISHKALLDADLDENTDLLPVFETVRTQKVLVIEPDKDNKEDVEFILDVRNLAAKHAPIVPKADKKDGRIRLVSDDIIKLRRHITEEAVKTKELRTEYPQLNINVFESTAKLNGVILDLHPTDDNVRKDVNLFLKYMDGYSQFHGDHLGMQYRYFEFANWFFCSPFMATMRDMAARYDQNRLPYPVFGLVYGQSKAGKTSFLETLLKMMIGQKPKIAAQEFTRSSIENLKRTVQGAPIIVDDMINTRFNQHAIETIKTDDFGVAEHLTNYSAVVISANEDVKAVAPEVIRRTVICRVEAGLTNTEVMKSNIVRSVQKDIGTAFYREYLRRMFELLPDLIETMKSDDTESAPDILKVSSEIIVAIIGKYKDLPVYIRPLSLESYFSEEVTGKHAIQAIRSAWKTSRKSFKIDKRTGELRYNAGQTYEADRLIKELPETLEARKSREWVVMNLEEAKIFFGIDFKPKFGLWSFMICFAVFSNLLCTASTKREQCELWSSSKVRTVHFF